MSKAKKLSEAAAALGAKGGAAGTGEAKRRGNRKFYQRLRALGTAKRKAAFDAKVAEINSR